MLEFSPKDYLWWGLQDPQDLNLIPVDEIKDRIYNKIISIVNNLNDSDVTLKLSEELLNTLKTK